MSMIASLRLFCLAAVLALCGWGLYLFAVSGGTAQAPALFLECPSSDLGERAVGPSEVLLVIKNPSDRPHAIVSVLEGCWPNCCPRARRW